MLFGDGLGRLDVRRSQGHRFRLAGLVGIGAALMAVVVMPPTGAADQTTAPAAAIQSLLDADRPQDAEVLARQSLADAVSVSGERSVQTADMHRLLGDALFNQQRYGEAKPHFRRALSIRQDVLGQKPDTALSAGDLAITLKNLGKLDEAEGFYRMALDIRIATLGPDDPQTAMSWYRLGRLQDQAGRRVDAAATMEQAIAAARKAWAPDHRNSIVWTGERAAMLHDAGDARAAEPAYREAIAAAEESLAPDDADLATFRIGLANLLLQTARPAEAEPLYRVALAAFEATGAAPGQLASILDRLGRSLDAQHREEEAVAAYSQSLDLLRAAEPRSETTAAAAMRLGVTLMRLDQPADAAPLFEDALAIREALEGSRSAGVADSARWAGNAARQRVRNAEAELYFRRALSASEAALGPVDPLTGNDVLSLGLLYAGQKRDAEARPLLDRALAIMDGPSNDRESAALTRSALAILSLANGRVDEAAGLAEQALDDMKAVSGPIDPRVADMMLALGGLRMKQDRMEEASALVEQAEGIFSATAPDGRARLRATALMGRVRAAEGRHGDALAIQKDVLARLESRYGLGHPYTQNALGELGTTYFALGDFEAAIDCFERAVAIIDTIAARDAEAAFSGRTGAVEDEAISRAAVYDFLIKSYDRRSEQHPELRDDLSAKAFLVAQRVLESRAAEAMAKMAARQASGDGALAKLVRERQDLLDAWRTQDRKLTGALGSPPASRNASDIAALTATLAEDDRRLGEIDERLRTAFPDYASLQTPRLLTVEEARATIAEGEVLLVFADTTRLDESAGFETYLWAIPRSGAPRWVRLAEATGDIGADIDALRASLGAGAEVRGAESLGGGSDHEASAVIANANKLYQATLSPVADLIAGQALAVVPSKRLGGLPFQMLVSGMPSPSVADPYRDARWLARDHAIAVLPSVSALALPQGQIASDGERSPYIGFANPLLTGRTGDDRRAFRKGGCDGNASAQAIAAATAPKDATHAAVLALAPLPETADEACALARTLGADVGDVLLGSAATEASLKRLSKDGELQRASIVHFATHGLVPGDLPGLSEPAIVLTPPAALADDEDGLLTASEVAGLRLDADWVILSACNTAAGDGGGEALSGLARAFFYAGARSLMVSHWPVDSDAAVRLTTGAVAAIEEDPSIGRAEALRRAMLTQIERGGRFADPAYWAPFSVIGTR